MKKLTFLVFAFLGFLQNIYAEEEPSLALEGGMDSLIALKDNFTIEYSDQVSGGCLPHPSRMKDKLEISLRQNGFSINPEKDWFGNKILITALGFDTSPTSCVVYLEANLFFWAGVVVPYTQGESTLAPLTYQFDSVLLSGSKSEMQVRVEKQMTEFGDDLFLELSRAKDAVKEKFPQILEYHKKQTPPPK